MNKKLIVVLGLALLAMIFVACGKDDSTSSGGSSSADISNLPALPKGDKTLANATAYSNGIRLPEIPNNTLKLDINIAEYQVSSEGTQIQALWEEKMEAYLGVDLDITWSRTPFVDYSANELVILQSGRIPDVATTTKGVAVNEYGEDEMLLDLSQYEAFMRYYPDYMVDTNGGENYAKNSDGSMYYFMDGFYNPKNIESAQSFTSFAYRFDILQEKGWLPATTLDEFTKLCQDIQRNIDNGSLDLDYVIINNTKDYSIYRGFVGIFHTWDCVYYNGTEWVFGPIEDNFREMLMYLNGLYEAGYIDPEFATADFNQGQVKATTNVGALCPTLWSGSVAGWNTAKIDENMEWGLAYLPEHEEYGTAWKWGSRQGGKSLNANMGIYISAKTKYPEYVVAMIDYQYSDQMVELMNWGIEGETYTKDGNTNSYTQEIMNQDNPANYVGSLGIMASSVCRTGVVFNPIDFNAMLEVSSIAEPWWSEDQGYYEGKYWVETSVNGGEDSVSPYDRPPVTYLSAQQQSEKAQLSYGGTCEKRARELAHQFIVGNRDIHSDEDWAAYIKDIKSQTDGDFDSILTMLNESTVK